VGAVNCDNEDALCRENNMRNFPEFKLLNKEEYEIYAKKSDLSMKGIIEWVSGFIPDKTTNIRHSIHAEEFLSISCSDKKKSSFGVGFLYFTKRFDTAMVIKSLANMLDGKILVGEVRGGNEKLAKEFGLISKKSFPILIAVCAGKDFNAQEIYQGDLKSLEDLGKFAMKFQKPKYCIKIRKESAVIRKKRLNQLKDAKSLSKEELKKKKISELIEIVQDLGLHVGLLEKSDFISAILEAANKMKSPEL
jgi:hypothetical protein